MNAVIFWIIVALFALGTLTTIATIGKERKPVTPGQAAVIALGNGMIIAAMVIDRIGG